MNVREIELYMGLMAHGTTARTAEVMAISQPAVSKAIQSLERSTGFALFRREHGRLRPTAEGEMFHREVLESFRGLAHLKSVAGRIRDFGSGQLRIACLSAFSSSLVPEALGVFHATHPEAGVTLQVHASSTIRDLIAEGRFDVGIVADEIPTDGVVAEPFVTIPAALALPASHRLAKKRSFKLSDLNGEHLVALSATDTTRREADAAFAAAGIAPRVIVETPFSATVCALVLAGLGVGIVDPVTAPGFVERGLVLRRLDPAPSFRTLLIFPPGRPRPLLAQDFITALRGVAEKERRIAVSKFGQRDDVGIN